MANFKAYVVTSPKTGNLTVRYRDGKTKLPNGRWKIFTKRTINKNERRFIDGKWKTAPWIAGQIAKKLEQKDLDEMLGIKDLSLSIEALIEEFLVDCRHRSLSPITIDDYKYVLGRFRVEGPFETLFDLTEEKLIMWRDEMCKRLMNSSAATNMVIVRIFCGWLQDTGKIKTIPFRRKMIPKKKKGGPKFCTTVEWLHLDEEAIKYPEEVRLAFHLAYAAGLRFAEIAGNKYRKGVLKEDLTWNLDGTVELTIREEISKTMAGKIVLDPSTIALLPPRGSGQLITLSRNQLRHIFIKCRKAIGYPTLNLHRLRHSFIK